MDWRKELNRPMEPVQKGTRRKTVRRAVSDIWPKSPLLLVATLFPSFDGGSSCCWVCLEKADLDCFFLADVMMMCEFYVICAALIFVEISNRVMQYLEALFFYCQLSRDVLVNSSNYIAVDVDLRWRRWNNLCHSSMKAV